MNNQHTVLIVDDMESNVAVLIEMLSDDYELLVASNGQSALALMEKQPVDLVLLDIMMPDMDGYEVCQKIKQHQGTSEIPVIFTTAKGEVDDETKGFSVGGADYITKPVSAPILHARIKTHLALYEKSRALTRKVNELEKTIRVLDGKLKRTQAPKNSKIVTRTPP